MSDSPRFSWTQPSCERCWRVTHPGREPVRLRLRELEQCVACGVLTDEGIYVRIDPATASYPSLLKD